MMKAMPQRKFSPIARAFSPLARNVLQRKCACGGTSGPTGECEKCRKKKLQHRSENLDPSSKIIHPPSSVPAAPPIVHDVLRSPGHPLDPDTRAYMEPLFSHDFGRVRVHTDARAVESTEAVNALAYTVGADVIFAQGQYAPPTKTGKKLLAHELTHVVQQAGGALRHKPSNSRDARSTLQHVDAEELVESMKESEAERPFAQESGLKLFRQSKESKDSLKTTSTKVKEETKKTPSRKLTADEVSALIIENNKSTLSTELLLCQIWKESGFDPNGKKGTHLGLLQMNKDAVKQVNKSSPKGVHCDYSKMNDAAENIRCATLYLQIRIDWANGDVTKGLEGFGTGTGYATNIQTCENCVKTTPKATDDCLKAIHP